MTNKALLTILIVMLSCGAMSQSSDEKMSSAKISTQEGIQKGNIQAILGAGKSGDPTFISQLETYRRKSGKHIEIHEARAIQLALARFGNLEDLQQVECEFLFGSPSVQHDTLDKLEYIGGWFSINSVFRVLDNPNYHAGGHGGLVYPPIGTDAARGLSTIIPDPPPLDSGVRWPGSKEDLERQRQWKNWIQEHKDSLNKLKPTGTGVQTSSNICRNILKRDRTFDHEALKSPKPGGAVY